ncbi:MAG: aminopeptidase P family protein [Candidatus Micrarchaeota archaeon]|nr:aminopeptidase P family protein [Candidatus Micrarchaeota archaeon]
MPKSSIKSKVQKIFASAKNTDVILLINTSSPDPNFLYLTGYTSGVFEYDILIFNKEGAYHITSQLEYDTAMLQKHPEIKIVMRNKAGSHRKLLAKLLNGKRVGINGGFMPVSLLNEVKKRYKMKKVNDVGEALEDARLVKDEIEVHAIKEAVRITKWAMLQIQREFKEGMTERQLAAKFDYISSSLGSTKPSFETIVCFGKNAALPHHTPDDTKLKDGDFILIDAGAKSDNYCSDLTRTFIFGKKDAEKEKVYDTVKEARIKAIHAIKPGMKGAQIHKVAADYIDKAHNGIYKGKFIHSLGHSLGIEVHDGPGFSPGAEQKLEPGMVITVEPGIYIPGFGGVRIEDDILITKDGAIIL